MHTYRLAAIFLLLAVACGTANAQALPPKAAPTQHVAVSTLAPPANSVFNAEQATKAYLAEVSPAQRARAAAFAEGNHWLMLEDSLAAVAICALLLFTRLSAKMRDLAAGLTRSRVLQSAIFAFQFLVILTVLTFPLSFYEDFLRRHAYGISNLTFAQWLGEFGIGFGLELVAGTIFIAVVYGLIRAAPRVWWIWCTVIAICFLAFAMLISPVYIQPLFNTSTPLKPGPLRSAIVQLADANGVPSNHIFVVNTSKQSNLLNANVSGLFGTTRISLDDTLLKRCTTREILAVVAHEMGHYVLDHSVMVLPWLGLILLVGFGFVAASFGGLTGLFGGIWNVREITDPAGLPLLYALFAIYMLIATPAVNTLSRTIEAQADIFGLNAARQPDAFARFFLLDAGIDDLTPSPLEEFVFWNHPSAAQRISVAMRWKAAHIHDPDIANGPTSP
ncbi:MAG: M48 family metallopeptidase [Alphaproteobacteria bacterium]|nr:M48 family metallopeptidase [Alphaproteobacteria bacterium]